MKGYSDRILAARRFVDQRQESEEHDKLRSLEYRPSHEQHIFSNGRATKHQIEYFDLGEIMDGEDYIDGDNGEHVVYFNEGDLMLSSDNDESSDESSRINTQAPGEQSIEHQIMNSSNISDIDRKNMMMEEMSRRHEHELKILQHSKEHEMQQVQQNYSNKLGELLRQIDHLKQVNEQWKKRLEDSDEEVRLLRRKLKTAELDLKISRDRELQIRKSTEQRTSEGESEKVEPMDKAHLNLSAQLLSPERAFRDNAIHRVRDHRKAAEWKKRESELTSELAALSAKYDKAKSLIQQLDVQKKEAEKRMEAAKEKYNTDNEVKRMKEIMKVAKSETDKAIEYAKTMKQSHEEIKKVNQTLRQMNDRYFAVLQSAQEAERALLEKERVITQLNNRNTLLQQQINTLKKQRIQEHQLVQHHYREETKSVRGQSPFMTPRGKSTPRPFPQNMMSPTPP